MRFGGSSRRRKGRRRRRRFYRRPLILVPLLLLLSISAAASIMVYQTDALLSSMRHISTPAPVITDNTYDEADDPDRPNRPISVDTRPAQTVLDQAIEERNLPRAADEDLGGNITRLASGVQDIAGGAGVATGLKDTSDEGFTVLVMGVDAQPGAAIDIGVRPDALMVIRFDPASDSCRSLSIPRDTRVELPGYGMSKINHALMVGGIPYQLLVTEDFIGTPIDHYLLIDFVAFSRLVDAVGGVEIDISEELDDREGDLRYEEGTYQFDGDEALAYARFRTYSDDGDPSRVKRQWSILGGLADAAKGRDLVDDVMNLVPTVEEHIRTDFSVTELATIAKDYGDSCVSGDGTAIGLLQGTRVRLSDPILDQVVYYNDVPLRDVRTRIEALLAE